MRSSISIPLGRALACSLTLHLAFLGLVVLVVVQQQGINERDYIDVSLIGPSRSMYGAAARIGQRQDTQTMEARKRHPPVQQEALSEMGNKIASNVQASSPATLSVPQSDLLSSGDPSGSSYEGSGYLPFQRASIIPSFKFRSQPVYPSSERAVGAEARVIVEVYINRTGSVDDVRVVKSGGQLFDHAVLEAVRSSSFQPGYLDGRPVAVRVQIPYSFTLK